MNLELAISEINFQLEAQYEVLRKIGRGYGAKARSVEHEIDFTSSAWECILAELMATGHYSKKDWVNMMQKIRNSQKRNKPTLPLRTGSSYRG